MASGHVVSRFDGDQHAGLQGDVFRRRPPTERLWSLVHVEQIADAVAGAVPVVETAFPQRVAGEHLDLVAGGAAREFRFAQCDQPLQYERVVRALFGRRFADADGASDIGSAFEVLSARVDEQDAGCDRVALLGGGVVMHDGTILPRTDDRWEARPDIVALLRPVGVELFGAIPFA